MVRASDGAEDGGLLSVVLDALAGHEGGAAIGELHDHGGVDVPSGLEDEVKLNQFVELNTNRGFRTVC